MRSQFFEYADLFCQIDTLPEIKMGKFTDLLYESAASRGIPLENALNEWMKWNIELFDVGYYLNDKYFEHFEEFQKKDPDYFNFTTEWFKQIKRKWHCNGVSFDIFGETYEENFKSAIKASKSGQFFTPMSVSNLIAECVFPNDDERDFCYFNDCCCGSGRLLLAGLNKAKNYKHSFYVAGDVDMSSVMMTTLNLMAHNAHGIVVCQDALMLSKPTCIYLVNEVDYPMRSGFISLRNLSVEDAIKRGWIRVDGDDGNETYVITNGNYEYIHKQQDKQ